MSYIFFETFRTVHGGRDYHWLNEHLNRLQKSFPSFSKVQAEKILKELLPFSQEKRIRISIGEAKDLQIQVEDLQPLPQKTYAEGVLIDETVFERPDPQWKYESSVYRKYASKDVFETLFIDKEKNVREGNITNVFFFVNGVWVTPPVGSCLPGIARQKVLEHFKKEGIEFQEREISKAEAQKAESIFLTNSIKGIVPVKAWESNQFEIPEKTILDIF